MAQLQYPTIDLIKGFVQGIYNRSFFSGQLESIFGNSVGKNTNNGKYGVISLPVQEPLIGIDIPVLVKDSKSVERPVIAIVAQDPLRNKKDTMLPQNPPGNAIIGTPFALHYMEKCYPQTSVYRRIIEMLLTKGYNVYITDARKIYPKDKALKKKEIDLLTEEIKGIKPYCVITLGSTAKEYYDKSGLKRRVINLLHPSQQNWDHWKQWIFEQAFYEKAGGKTGPYAGFAGNISQRSAMFDDQTLRKPMPDLIADLVGVLI